MNKFIAIIPARSGSKGLKSKNTLIFNNKPLIYWTINAALKSKMIDKIILTTDDEKILKMKNNYSDKKIFFHRRPGILASDKSPIYLTIKYFLKKYSENYDKFLLLQPTSPLRNYKHINEAINLFIRNKAKSCVSISKIKKTKDNFYKISKEKKLLFNKKNKNTMNRQLLDKYYEINGAIYISYIKEYLKNKSFKNDKTLSYYMDQKFSYDIDNKIDFKIAEFIFKNIKKF